ncbi:MAG: putative porin [Rudaea sp.]
MLKTFLIAAIILMASNATAADDPLVLPGEEAPASPWTWFGDVLLRGDRVTDIPRANDSNISRTFARGRFGIFYDPIPTLEFGAAIKLAVASNPNSDDRSYNDNERSNDIALDQMFVRWRPNDSTSLLAGKTVFPLELSPMVWDQDLRPVGISAQASLPAGRFNRFSIVAGYFDGNLPYGDHSRIGALQADYHWHEGEPTSADVLVSYLDFSNLRRLTEQGLARTNRHDGDTLISDFRLLDLQFVARFRPGGWPLESRLDLLRNLGAADHRDGARFSLVLGDRRHPHSWEFGISDQRIQRDAAMAAFNSDDWWFHSWARGVMPWIGYGFNATWNVRLAEFHERRDGVSQHTDRLLLDVNARW